jgi:hypothetical protein
MSVYITFFGKSQYFTTCYYNRDGQVHDFNTVIKDFDLLESKVFTVDNIDNREILSRYFFNSQGRDFCLLKLYSFAQAFNGPRIDGSIYGVGLISDQAISLSKENLDLLRAAKDNFAKLSLEGLKFKKSNFQDDTSRIWKAIVTNEKGNLLDKINVSNFKIHNSSSPVAFYVKDLFQDAIKLNDRISDQDTVYFSEDLEHLKRTQEKWGKNAFPIYWEQNNKFVIYEKPATVQRTNVYSTGGSGSSEELEQRRMRNDLESARSHNDNLKRDLKKTKEKQQIYLYTIVGLGAVLILGLLYFLIAEPEKVIVSETKPTIEKSAKTHDNSIGHFLVDNASLDSGIVFFKGIQYIYSFDSKTQLADSTKFNSLYKAIEKSANKYNLDISNVAKVYQLKRKEINQIQSSKPAPQEAPKPAVKPAAAAPVKQPAKQPAKAPANSNPKKTTTETTKGAAKPAEKDTKKTTKKPTEEPKKGEKEEPKKK